MIPIQRRTFIRHLGATSVLLAALPNARSVRAATSPGSRPMTICLAPGSIGVRADQREAIVLAARYGFESVTADTGYVAGLSAGGLEALLGFMKEKGVVWGQAGLTVSLTGAEDRYRAGLKTWPETCAALQRAGVNRVGTWLSPGHDRLTYRENFKLHVARMRPVAEVLKAHGQRLGLEYIGTKTLLTSRRYPFVHTMAETLELIEAVGTGNVGLVMDSWHWWQAGDTPDDIRRLTAEQVVSADLNDAPKGVEFDRQRDNQRELPLATGVIDAGAFLNALKAIGFDGPVRAEPFNRVLNDMDNDAACAATAAAMKKAFALIRG